ncbi:MAG: LacI family DNA-binding transcriptional regulator [Micromonosporaceae bacterium]
MSGSQRRAAPTLETVAAEAGVSRATVSRVINDSPRVSPEVKAAVRQAITRLGYVPNRAARSLVTRRTDTIAMVVTEPDTTFFSDPYFAHVVRATIPALEGTDVQLVLVMAQTKAEHARLTRYLQGQHVDGVLLMSLHGDDPLPRILQRARVPTVSWGRPPRPLAHIPYVDADNVGGGRQAVGHLLKVGRKRIATIAGPADMCVGADRLLGYREAMREAGHDDRLVAHGDFSQQSGERAMDELLAREPRLDGVFAASDLMAAGALRALRRAGRRVPDDVAVVGHDDLEVARLTEPTLTTVHQPVDEMARTMTVMLLEQVHDGKEALPAVLPTYLVERSSA